MKVESVVSGTFFCFSLLNVVAVVIFVRPLDVRTYVRQPTNQPTTLQGVLVPLPVVHAERTRAGAKQETGGTTSVEDKGQGEKGTIEGRMDTHTFLANLGRGGGGHTRFYVRSFHVRSIVYLTCENTKNTTKTMVQTCLMILIIPCHATTASNIYHNVGQAGRETGPKPSPFYIFGYFDGGDIMRYSALPNAHLPPRHSREVKQY